MSVVAIKINKTEITIASDTQTTSNGHMKFDGSQNLQHICKLEKFGDIIIGSVGSAKTIQLMGMFLETNKLKTPEERELVRFFKEFESWLKKETGDNEGINNNAFIVVFKNKAFYFDSFYIREIIDYWAIGSGSIWALPTLEMGHSVETAVEMACKFDLYCSSPVKTIKKKI